MIQPIRLNLTFFNDRVSVILKIDFPNYSAKLHCFSHISK